MQNSDGKNNANAIVYDARLVEGFGAVMFDDRDSFGIIEAISKADWLTIVAGGKKLEVDPRALAGRLEEAAARWLVERNEALVPREVLLQLLDGVIKAETRSQDYKVYDRGGREVGLGELLDVLLQDTRLYSVSDSEYFLAPIEPLTHRDAWRLCRVLTAIARSGREAVELYCNAFAEGCGGNDPFKWYHEKLTQVYGLH